jgi:hypothetical protein
MFTLMSQRKWITPLVIGSFLLSAVTGVLMFFHFDVAWNKKAHEWLSWALLAGVLLHILASLPTFKAYFSKPLARVIMGVFVVLLIASFVVPKQASEGPSYAVPMRALATTPLSGLAVVARLTPEALRDRLQQQGYAATSDQQTVQDLVGTELKVQVRVLRRVMSDNDSH